MKIKMQQKEFNKTLNEAFKDFYKHCRVKNLSERTLDYYEECFEVFIKFYGQSNLLEEITENTVNDYILYLKNNTKSNSISINNRIRGIRVILYYFMKLGYMETFKIQLIKAEKRVKETYSDEELKLLLKKPDIKKCIFTEYRDWAIINYLLSTGNRVATLVNVKVKDISFEEEYIIMEKTKNKKQQIIPLSVTLSKILSEYLKYRSGEPEDYLFCSAYGAKLTTNAIEHSISKYNRRRGVMKTSIHLFRHTFAKKWILAGGDIFRLQKVLGHSSLDIVREYVNMFGSDLQRNYDKFNALDQMVSYSKHIKMR